MKTRHEARIEVLTEIQDERASHILLFGARVGEHDYPVRLDLARAAILPDRYPAERQPIQLDLARLDFQDHEPEYWQMQVGNLQRQFARKVRDRLRAGDIGHLSLFALAPQPLLVELGRLLSDIAAVSVYQLHRISSAPQNGNGCEENALYANRNGVRDFQGSRNTKTSGNIN